MPSFTVNLLVTIALPVAIAQRGPWGGSAGPGGPGNNGGPPCVNQCWTELGATDWSQNGLSSVCSNATAVDTINTCIAGSSCNDTDKQNTYQLLAQICANDGNPITAAPEASFSATSGGSAYPTGTGSWQSYASQYSSGGGPGGWHKGGPHGPFGAGAPGNGYGPWGSSGAWVDGPWTSWWGSSGACPPSTWSGWTSNGSTNAPWTTWTACTAETTATNVVTTTTTSGGTAAAVTTTNFGLRVAEATSSASSSGSSSTSAATISSVDRLSVFGVSILSMLILLSAL